MLSNFYYPNKASNSNIIPYLLNCNESGSIDDFHSFCVAIYRALRECQMLCGMKYVSDDTILIKGLTNEFKCVFNPF